MTKAKDAPYEYHSYLLRLWRRGLAWHVMLEPVGSGERQVFADFESMVEFLRKQTAGDSGEEQLPA